MFVELCLSGLHFKRSIAYLSIPLYFVSAICIALLWSKQKNIGKDGMLSI